MKITIKREQRQASLSLPSVSNLREAKTNILNKLLIAFILASGMFVYSCNERKDFLNDSDTTLKSAETIPTATITIDESSVIKVAAKSMLGFAQAWGYWPMRVTMEDGDNLNVSQNCINVATSAGIRLPLNRMSFQGATLMKWKEAIGPLANRTLQGNPSVKQRMGIVEWVTLVRSIEPGAEFVLSPNFEQETPQDHADLAEFLTGDGSVNINGGENWAQKRIELGISKPVKVVIWELGNEVDLKINIFTPQYYIDKARQTIAAIKGVDPNAKFAAVGATAPWDGKRDWKGWNTAVLQGLGSQIDYLTFHPYYGRAQSALNNMENYMNQMKQQILAETGSDRIKLYVSEHGVWPSDINDQTTWTQTKDLKGTLFTGAFIGRLYKRPDVAFSTTHAFGAAGAWGAIYRDGTVNSRYTTGIAEMANAFYKAVGERVVKSSLSGADTVNLETTAMPTTNGLNLVIFNLDPNIKRYLYFQFSQGPYTLKKSVIVTAEALDSYNTLGNKLINTIEKTSSALDVFSNYTIPEKSMVVLYLEKKPV